MALQTSERRQRRPQRAPDKGKFSFSSDGQNLIRGSGSLKISLKRTSPMKLSLLFAASLVITNIARAQDAEPPNVSDPNVQAPIRGQGFNETGNARNVTAQPWLPQQPSQPAQPEQSFAVPVQPEKPRR